MSWVFHLLNSLSFASLLFIMAIGLSITFGLMRIVNLAHGSIYVLAGYVALDVVARTGNYWTGLGAGIMAVTLVGAAISRGLLNRLVNQELPQIVVTLGIAFVFNDLILAYYGGEPVHPSRPPGLGGLLVLGERSFPWYRLGLVAMAVALGIALGLWLNRSRVGAMVRAAVDDEEMARTVGVPVPKLLVGVFAFGSALAGFAGIWGGSFTGLTPSYGFEILLLALLVVVLGGVGSLGGAALASVLVAGIQELGRVFFPEVALATPYLLVVVVLLLRPQGLFADWKPA